MQIWLTRQGSNLKNIIKQTRARMQWLLRTTEARSWISDWLLGRTFKRRPQATQVSALVQQLRHIWLIKAKAVMSFLGKKKKMPTLNVQPSPPFTTSCATLTEEDMLSSFTLNHEKLLCLTSRFSGYSKAPSLSVPPFSNRLPLTYVSSARYKPGLLLYMLQQQVIFWPTEG